MKKETLAAIFLGITFGVFVAVFMVSKTKEREVGKNKTITSTVKSTPTVPVKETQQNLEILEPTENAIVNAKSVTIAGKTSKDSLIVIQSPIKDLTLNNKTENFSTDFPLAFGENVIHITVYPKDSSLRQQDKELRVYYLDEQ